MDRSLLPHLPAVLAVARSRSFARAAAQLGLGPSAVSHSVKAVEERLGEPLFARTTRSVSLTEAGEIFIGAAEHAFAELETAADAVRAGQRQVTGLLRINAPHVAMHVGLAAILAEAALRHPALTIEVIGDDALTDIVGQGFDLGIRLGEMIAQDMVAVRMTPPFRAIMVAAPSYLSQRGVPSTLDELSQHNCIGFRLLASGAIYDWDVQASGVERKVKVTGTARVSDPLSARELALRGVGIAYALEPVVRADLENGSLLEILSSSAIEEPGFFVYFPQRASRARKVRAFIDITRELLAKSS